MEVRTRLLVPPSPQPRFSGAPKIKCFGLLTCQAHFFNFICSKVKGRVTFGHPVITGGAAHLYSVVSVFAINVDFSWVESETFILCCPHYFINTR